MFVRPILNFLFPNAPEEMLQLYHSYVRKAAHFTEYAVLAFLAIRAFRRSSNGLMRTAVYGVLVVVSVAAFDEFNQSFDLSRTGSWYDVLLDISGGITAIVTMFLFMRIRDHFSNTRD